MLSDEKQIERLTKEWEKTDILWKRASKKSQEATAAYNWMRDDHATWNRVLVKRMRETIAFRKADAARRALVDFISHRTVSRPD